MDWEKWQKKELISYLEFLMHNYRVMDAFWFINLERELGHDQACRYNEMVWSRVGRLAAQDLKRRFGLEGGGLEGFRAAMELFPWSILVGYEYRMQPGELIIQVPHCPPQEARLQRGLGEYSCSAMHRGEFEAFAGEIDPRIRVECLFAPPGDHPPDLFCRWRFTLAEGEPPA